MIMESPYVRMLDNVNLEPEVTRSQQTACVNIRSYVIVCAKTCDEWCSLLCNEIGFNCFSRQKQCWNTLSTKLLLHRDQNEPREPRKYNDKQYLCIFGGNNPRIVQIVYNRMSIGADVAIIMRC